MISIDLIMKISEVNMVDSTGWLWRDRSVSELIVRSCVKLVKRERMRALKRWWMQYERRDWKERWDLLGRGEKVQEGRSEGTDPTWWFRRKNKANYPVGAYNLFSRWNNLISNGIAFRCFVWTKRKDRIQKLKQRDPLISSTIGNWEKITGG